MIYYSADSVLTANTAIIMTIHSLLLPQPPTCTVTLEPLQHTADTALHSRYKELCVVVEKGCLVAVYVMNEVTKLLGL